MLQIIGILFNVVSIIFSIVSFMALPIKLFRKLVLAKLGDWLASEDIEILPQVLFAICGFLSLVEDFLKQFFGQTMRNYVNELSHQLAKPD